MKSLSFVIKKNLIHRPKDKVYVHWKLNFYHSGLSDLNEK